MAHTKRTCAVRWCRRVSPVRLWDFVKAVRRDVGFEFTVMMLSTYVGLKGFLYILTTDSLLPYMKDLGYDGLVYQRTITLAYVPWGMKGLVGLLSDALPVGGYHKRFYMLFTSLSGVASLICLLFLSSETARNAAWVIGVLFFCVQFQIATVDLMCEGMYSQVMSQKPHVGANLVTFVNGCTTVGAFVGRLVVGPVSDRFGARPLFILALPIALQSLLPISLNYLMEERVSPGCGVLTEKVRDQKNVFFMAFAVAVGASGVAALTLIGGSGMTYILPYCGVVSVLLIALCALCLPVQLAKCNVFFFLDKIVHISISGALDFFYTAAPACVPNGPHFDYTYYSTYTAVAGTLATWLGLVLFQVALSSWTYRSIFWLTSAVRILASLFDYVMTTRLNVRIGIPDKLMYLLGDAIILSLVGTLSHMPGVILTSRLCPPRLESTVYAILAGISNFGHSVSTLLGIRAIKAANITTTATEGQACNFENLPALILVAHCVLPMVSIPMALYLLPGTPMDEPLEGEAADCMRRRDKEGEADGDDADTSDEETFAGKGERRTRRRKMERPGGRAPKFEAELVRMQPDAKAQKTTLAGCVHHAVPTEDEAFDAEYGELDVDRSERTFAPHRELVDEVEMAEASTLRMFPVLGEDREGSDLPQTMGVPVFFTFTPRGSGRRREADDDRRQGPARTVERRVRKPHERGSTRVRRGDKGQRAGICYSLCSSDQVSLSESREFSSGSSPEASEGETERERTDGEPEERGGPPSEKRRDVASEGILGHHSVAVAHGRAPPSSQYLSSSFCEEQRQTKSGRRKRSDDGDQPSSSSSAGDDGGEIAFVSDSDSRGSEAVVSGEVLRVAMEDAETTATLAVDAAEVRHGRRKAGRGNLASDSQVPVAPATLVSPPSSGWMFSRERDSPGPFSFAQPANPPPPLSTLPTLLLPFPSSLASEPSSPAAAGLRGSGSGQPEDEDLSGLVGSPRRPSPGPASWRLPASSVVPASLAGSGPAHSVFGEGRATVSVELPQGPGRGTFVEETCPQMDSFSDLREERRRESLEERAAPSREESGLYPSARGREDS
ncbi:putative folate/methotrexate transporter [Neospora caninum Liverpool]|uniref:Folate/methotrexate transporter, putative n=1 Tax=Neospora caninum (strain Liverpool) TaxID=572307 RepID=F0VGP6_NEOCL|nr:putative folate/methotrexate transporter [Neospora caninum Liverpool]CBZ52890.1 putative folate/methotrexate transporter [Neospora caninum Liverpool]CEL66872.1 TPA: folate/methotrexate transporter, putative [Neospora caninum Liverpool]|eukprot:XP_003882922.1 putative folate/methotrexate transporter [Neospora caninum Liverpool]